MGDREPDEIAREERVIYGLIAISALPAVIQRAVEGGVFDAGVTLCLLGAVAAVVGLRHRRAPAVPRARVTRRRAAGSRRRPR